MTKAAGPNTRASAHRTPFTPAAAIDDPALLGGSFEGTSWATWRSILKAAYAEPLDAAELARFRSVAGDRDPPRHRVRELIVVAGRRSGKDSIASAIATTASIADYSAALRPGERASVLCLAVDREQAKIVNRYIKGYFDTVPLLTPLVTSKDDDGLELANNVEIVVATNSYRSVRGRTIACAIFDEAAFWRSDESATPDVETYNAVLPGMITLPGAILIIITTAYRRVGLAYQKWQRHFGKNDDDVLVVYGPSTAFNPSLPQSVIDAALERDAEAAGAEWLSQWRSDLSDFLDRELIAAAVDRGEAAHPPQPSLRYTAFADPSGGRGDSFTAGIAHVEGNGVILDCLYERRAPFDPSVVVAEVAALLRSYGLAEVTGDRYAAQWVVEAFAKEGIAYHQADRDRSAIYLDALPLFTAGRARLLDNVRLVNQLASLERRTSRIGKDRVDHPPGGTDDVANAASGALVLAVENVAAPALIHSADFLVDAAPVSTPRKFSQVFASAAVKDGTAAACWWLHSPHYGVPLILADFEAGPFDANFFGMIRARILDLAAPCAIAVPWGLVAPSALMEQAAASDLPGEKTDALIADPAALAIRAAMHVGAGQVKIGTAAHEKAQHHPLAAALQFRAIEPSSPLQLAALTGIVAALGDTVTARAA